MFPLLSMGKNRAWRTVKGEHDADEGYVVHAADDDCKESVSRARSKAICALATRGILLIDEESWPRVHPVVQPYMNRKGAQVAVTAEVDDGSVENDVLGCHSVLRRNGIWTKLHVHPALYKCVCGRRRCGHSCGVA